MEELEGLVIRECALSGAEGVLFVNLMDEVGRRCGNPISRPLQTLLDSAYASCGVTVRCAAANAVRFDNWVCIARGW